MLRRNSAARQICQKRQHRHIEAHPHGNARSIIIGGSTCDITKTIATHVKIGALVLALTSIAISAIFIGKHSEIGGVLTITCSPSHQQQH
jgi:hypothetical protein